MATGKNPLQINKMPESAAHFSYPTELPEQHNKAIHLDDHSDEGEAEQNDEDATKESCRSLGLVPLEEESERSLQPNDEGKAAQEKDLKERI